MKVLFINTWDQSGGAAVACTRLANSLIVNNIDCKVLTLTKSGTKNFITPVSFLKQKLGLFNLYFEKLLFFFQQKSKELRFSFSTSQFGVGIHNHPLVLEADIIHLHWINFGYISADDLSEIFKLNKPIFITLHDMWYFTGGCHHSNNCENYQNQCGNCVLFLKNPSENDLSFQEFRRKQNVFNSLKSATIISCSDWLLNRSKKSKLLGNYDNVSIPNTIDTDLFKPLNQRALRQKYGLNSNKKYLLAVAAKLEVYWKGFEYLVETANLLAQDFELLIVGNIEKTSLQRFVIPTKSLGIITNQAEMVEIYNLANVFITTSLFENLPNTIMEALSCGLPCAGFRTGGIPEMIIDNQNGVLANLKDSKTLANGIKHLTNHSNFEDYKLNARNFALQHYNQELISSKIIELYKTKLLK